MQVAPLYTWESYQGSLHLYQQDNNLELLYQEKDKPIKKVTKYNVEEICYKNRITNIDTFCQNYFFEIKEEGDILAANFFESDLLSNYELSETQPKGNFANLTFNSLQRRKTVKKFQGASFNRFFQGLNLEGKCINKTCQAYNKRVVIPKGIGEFHLVEELDQSTCPACKKQIPFEHIINMGFSNCEAIIKASQIKRKQNDGKTIHLPIDQQIHAKSGQYETFEPSKDCEWAYIKITVVANPSGFFSYFNPFSYSSCTLL